MKRYGFLIVLILLFANSTLHAQRKLKDGTVTGSADEPSASAVLELESNNKAFLPPRMTTTERNAIANPAPGLLIYNTDLHCVEYFNSNAWISKCTPGLAAATITNYNCAVKEIGTLSEGNPAKGIGQVITVTVAAAGSYSISATANGVTFAGSGKFAATGEHTIVLAGDGTALAAGSNTFTSAEATGCSFSRTTAAPLAGGNALCDKNTPTTVVPVTLNDGKVWMDRNLGASRAAQSVTDYQAYGCLYQWGRGNDGHASILHTSALNSPINGTTTSLSSSDVPGHSDFIISESNDWQTSKNDNLWQGANAINNPCPFGFRVPTSLELQQVTATMTLIETNGFTFAGYRNSNSSLPPPGLYGSYWTSDTDGSLVKARIIADPSAGVSNINTISISRPQGMLVRCIKN